MDAFELEIELKRIRTERKENKENDKKERKKEYRQKNKEEIKEYYEKNKDKRNKLGKHKRKIDKNYNIKCRLRSHLSGALKNYTKTGKIQSSSKYGIDYKKVIEHLKPFPEDISLYHVDHIKPLCSFNFINEDGSTNLDEIKKAFAPENHQWLLAEENLSKGGSMPR